jgi:hypothetical protein
MCQPVLEIKTSTKIEIITVPLLTGLIMVAARIIYELIVASPKTETPIGGVYVFP